MLLLQRADQVILNVMSSSCWTANSVTIIFLNATVQQLIHTSLVFFSVFSFDCIRELLRNFDEFCFEVPDVYIDTLEEFQLCLLQIYLRQFAVLSPGPTELANAAIPLGD